MRGFVRLGCSSALLGTEVLALLCTNRPLRSVKTMNSMEMEVTAEEARRLMEILGGERRFSLVQRLLENGNQSVAALNGSSISGPNMSHHLKHLRAAGIIRTERRGSKRLNSVKLELLMNLAAWLNEAIYFAQLNSLTEFLEHTSGNETVLSEAEY